MYNVDVSIERLSREYERCSEGGKIGGTVGTTWNLYGQFREGTYTVSLEMESRRLTDEDNRSCGKKGPSIEEVKEVEFDVCKSPWRRSPSRLSPLSGLGLWTRGFLDRHEG